jgi:hypothetical protein
MKIKKNLLVYKLSGEQIWKSDISETSVGYCSLTDEEIDDILTAIQTEMESKGRYHVFRSNWHMFIQIIWRRTCKLDDDQVPLSSDLSNICPAWFIAGDENGEDRKSQDNIVW